jgi:chemotaxis protein CheZ
MPTANTLGPVWEDLRAPNASLQRTLNEFRSSFHRASVAGKEMPDARLRLDHVLKLTEDGEAVRANLDEVLMAQSYQDLSGQIIRTVIKLVVELERTLAHFSRLAGDRPADESDPPVKQVSDVHGPSGESGSHACRACRQAGTALGQQALPGKAAGGCEAGSNRAHRGGRHTP